MPGTIRVSIVEFSGNDPLAQSSQNSIKVSLGNSEFQTYQRGEFFFPLKSMRDNIIVTVQDKEENKVSSAGVETRLVIQKGVWDTVLFFEGGWQVHLKLQFVLSDEDREKIRTTRQSALMKKREEVLQKQIKDPRMSDGAANAEGTVIRPLNAISDSTSRLGNTLPSVTNAVIRESYDQQIESGRLPADIRNNQAYVSVADASLKESLSKKSPDEEKVYEVVDWTEVERPELSEKDVIANTFQGTKGEDAISERLESASAAIAFSESESSSQVVSNLESVKGEFAGSTSFCSERDILSEEEGTSELSVIRSDQSEEKSVSTCKTPSFSDIELAIKNKPSDSNSIVFHGVWIFPDERPRLCVTSSKVKLCVRGDFVADPEEQTRCADKVSVRQLQDASTSCKGMSERSLSRWTKRGLGIQPHNETGWIGQVVKVAIMVGFAVQIALNRR